MRVIGIGNVSRRVKEDPEALTRALQSPEARPDPSSITFRPPRPSQLSVHSECILQTPRSGREVHNDATSCHQLEIV